jgi:hypothetical protein
MVLSIGGTAVIAYLVKAVIGLRPSIEAEESGLDDTDHGEAGYHPEEGGGHGEAMAARESVATAPAPQLAHAES